ncbi:ComF family protein [Peterkaempfera bronchialis]|uniref:ComF family protein n=1 Tax=Peterkaempfera bronchialis TaxID=2126346 RepID=A0A345SVP0_9ACTN|nr:phosphoribosyltransferase family protein [Peterkaempfera bronchialis]AXI77795.1 ComF family protein [Peterkaempfera bronchialis]
MDPAAAPRPARPLDALLDLLLPGRCAGCGSDGGQLCTRCRAALETAPGHPVRPDPPPPGLPPVYAATEYAGPVRGLLLAHKERGALRLADPLGRALATAVHAAAADGLTGRAPIPLLLVPVPSARRAVRARGHDPVHRLARVAARELRRAGVPGRAAAVLRPVRPVADQAGLGAADRRRNLAGALAVRPGAAAGLRHRQVVLVDDLVTTGATLAEAARALGAVGAQVPVAATVAATARRTGGTGRPDRNRTDRTRTDRNHPDRNRTGHARRDHARPR